MPSTTPDYIGGILSDQIKMYQGTAATITGTDSTDAQAISTAATSQIKQLQNIPSLGGSTNKIDVTCLEDTAHRYINGLKDYGDSIDFTFLYDPINYKTLNDLNTDTTYAFKLQFKAATGYSTGEIFAFQGKPSVSLDDVGVDSALTFTLSIALQTKIYYIAPTT